MMSSPSSGSDNSCIKQVVVALSLMLCSDDDSDVDCLFVAEKQRLQISHKCDF